jgi:hypothetical protein
MSDMEADSETFGQSDLVQIAEAVKCIGNQSKLNELLVELNKHFSWNDLENYAIVWESLEEKIKERLTRIPFRSVPSVE